MILRKETWHVTSVHYEEVQSQVFFLFIYYSPES